MVLFEMKNIKKSFGSLEVLKDISLQVEEGEVLSIIGPSGSGKSTLLIDVLYNECQRQYLEAMAFQAFISRRWNACGAHPRQ